MCSTPRNKVFHTEEHFVSLRETIQRTKRKILNVYTEHYLPWLVHKYKAISFIKLEGYYMFFFQYINSGSLNKAH